MAGRGRGATLPAWMTQQGSAAVSNNDSSNSNSNYGSGGGNNYNSRQFEDAPSYNDRGGGRNPNNFSNQDSGNNMRDNYQNDDRKRQRSPARDDPRGGGGGGSGWQPRAKRSSNFDIAPPAGMSVAPVGIVNAGGVSNASLSHHSANYNSSGSSSSYSSKSDGPNAQTRHARRIYAGGIPQKATESEILNFFNDVVTKALLPKRVDSPPVIKIYLNAEKSYAFVEFDSIELTTACLQLDGLKYDHPSQTTTIRVRRPNDYRPELLPPPGPIPVLNLAGLVSDASGGAPANFGPNKIFIGGLPYNLTDAQIMELLNAFGPIKNFHQVRDPGSLTSKGYAFCEFFSQEVADAACAGLHGLQLGEKCLSVRIASTGANNATVTGHSSGGGGAGGGHFSNYNANNGSGGGVAGGGYGNSDNYSSRNNNNNNINGGGYGGGSGYGNNNQSNSYTNDRGGGYGGSGVYSNNSNNNSSYGNNGGQYNSNSNGGYNSGGHQYQQQQQQTQQQYQTSGSIQSATPTRVLRLSNMLTPQDLQSDSEIADIKEDVRLECIEHGRVIQVLIPRRKEGYAVEGLIFVEFQAPAMARSAALVLHGRKFAENTVGVQYYDEARFANGILN